MTIFCLTKRSTIWSRSTAFEANEPAYRPSEANGLGQTIKVVKSNRLTIGRSFYLVAVG
jgi:hypothetical protein